MDWREALACIGRFVYFMAVATILVIALAFATNVHARDLGQWETSDPATRHWFDTLMQPDNPAISCCGEADAYWADTIEVKGGKTFAIITDDRPDGPLMRPHIPIGTKIEVPDRKLKWDRGNPTGHNVIFLSTGLVVYCFVQGSGT